MNLDLWKGLSDEDKAIVQNAVSEMETRRTIFINLYNL
jgi:TRAP-type C4-dicarboxylate transport system substrate-binding protein